MYLFDDLTPAKIGMWFVVLTGLLIANELARRNKWLAATMFIALPVVLTIAVWPSTASPDTTAGSWFSWVKVYSALAGCIWFMAVRYVNGFVDRRYVKDVVALILAANILEAVVREIDLSSANGFIDGMDRLGGGWNHLNGAAGILNILTICGWVGIFVSRKEPNDMKWPDMLWFWIVAYDIWNFTFLYNAAPNWAFYSGAALIASATIPAFFGGKGAWLQHRAYTLGFFAMFAQTFPAFEDTSSFAVKTTLNPTAMWTLSIISFACNFALFAYQLRRIIRKRLNPLTDELYVEHPDYREVELERRAPMPEAVHRTPIEATR